MFKVIKIIKLKDRLNVLLPDGYVRPIWKYAWIYDGETLRRVPLFCTCSQEFDEDNFEEQLIEKINQP